MSPNQNFIINSVPMEPVSRTYQYRKIMKPMLERKRRARINKCLDELKELMASAMQSEGENVSKLEKADILELTVRHLHSLREKNSLHSRQDQNKIESFWEGFRKCASEVSQYLSKFDQKIGSDLLGYINRCTQVDPGNSTAITIRSDAYLFGTYRYQDFLLKQGVDLRQNVNNFGQLPARTGVNENEVSVNVWRPW